MKLKFLPLLLLALAGCRPATSPVAAQTAEPEANDANKTTALDRYLARPEPAYSWETAPEGEYAPGDGDANLRLVSQTWQEGRWTHRLQIFRPKNPRFKDAALINIQFGSGSFAETFAGRTIADVTGVTVVNLFNVPNQPLYDRTEDELIAYTLGQTLQSGDETWPLLFPMTKAVIKTMDAVGEWSQRQGGPIKRFLVSGASKRGWTTYLTGASRDPRVVGLIPIVYDNLHLARQIPHQKEVWNETSPLAAPYAAIGLFDMVDKPEGQKLISLIDPYAAKERLTVPKLLIHATNDGYWPHDSAQFYFDDLPGDNRLFYVPNAPHTLGSGVTAVVSSAAAWGNLVLAGQKAPNVALQGTPTHEGWNFTAQVSDGIPQMVRLWVANSPSPDFRHAKWNAFALQAREGIYGLTISNAKLLGQNSHVAAFAEIEVEAAPLALRLSSPMWEHTRTSEAPRSN